MHDGRSHAVTRFPTGGLRRMAPALAALAIAGCASTGKKYEQAVQMEQQGRAADAAQRYVDVLKRDPGVADARLRLKETGDRAMADYAREAESLSAAGRPDAAADRFADADALRRAATGAGVELAVSDDYARRRADAYDRAIEGTLAESRDAGTRGGWDAAVSRLERAASRYQPTAEQKRRLDQARYDAFLGHARHELETGRFREAFAQAARALDVFGRTGIDADAALAMQGEALRRGSVHVAMLPPGVRDAFRDSVPGDLAPAMGEALATRHWSQPPAFVVLVGRPFLEDVRYGRGQRETTPYDAALRGRQVGADLAVVVTVDSARREDGVTTDRVAAKTRAGADTAYTVNQGRRTLWTRFRFTLVEVGSRRTLYTGAVDGHTSAPYRYATFRGDAGALDLHRGDRDLFRGDWERRVNQELVRELVDQLNDRLASAIFDRLLAQVP
ncbi:MAG: hypothetical protein JWM27_1112 [Gemmatimonadetes bacterium]|nr:hypothetical protein [Gemmatimonadota bacterium]